MKIFIPLAIATIILTSCSMNGMKAPPSAAGAWTMCDPYLYETMSTNDYFEKKREDMFSCRYDPIGGGDIEADACVRKKGWFVVGWDAIPQNKIYETNCPRKEKMLREQQNKKSK